MNAVYECYYCQIKTPDLNKFVFHMKKYGSEKTLRFQCPFCLTKLSDSNGFKKHLRNHEIKGEGLHYFHRYLVMHAIWNGK